MKIFLVRHGETTGDVEDRYGGRYDDHLTEKGKLQLAETAKQLEGKGIEVVFVSPLIRARESAEIIQARLGCSVETIEEIQERNYGILGGLTKSEAIERYPDAVERHKDPRNTDPEGEDFDAFHERVIRGFKAIVEQDYRVAVVVSHGGPIKSILRQIGEEVPERIGDGGIMELDVD